MSSNTIQYNILMSKYTILILIQYVMCNILMCNQWYINDYL